MSRNTFHVSLYVDHIPAAVDRYRRILGIEPAKVRPDYAKFEIEDPPVILSLAVGGTPGTISHLGVRYPATGEVASQMVRAESEGLETLRQDGARCCYAKADKFWLSDADGVRWEMYTLLEDIEQETAADEELRRFLGQAPGAAMPVACGPSGDGAPCQTASGCAS
jgi:catechol 2,3-dioxygenase-like lactoylglutathione lyase family enzyme